jgi:hypothetical protein
MYCLFFLLLLSAQYFTCSFCSNIQLNAFSPTPYITQLTTELLFRRCTSHLVKRLLIELSKNTFYLYIILISGIFSICPTEHFSLTWSLHVPLVLTFIVLSIDLQIVKFRYKLKQSHYRPGQTLRFPEG